MPTGYTAAIKDGISFERFVWDCARAFGALVMMRDEPTGAIIPEEFKPSDYHEKRLAEITGRLQVLRAMGPEEAQAGAQAAYDAEKAFNEKRVAEIRELRGKYETMLAKVTAWQPPTDEHAGLKSFMEEQLRNSIDFDCSTDYYMKQPVLLDGAAWLQQVISDAEAWETRCLHQHAEEVTRTADRNAWLKALRESVPPPTR